jgi:hypothetical protein
MTKGKLLESLVDLKQVAHDKRFNKASKLHKYWSRKPWYIVEKYIEEYSRPGDVVLDPFCGSGAIGLECVLSDRDFIGYDLNPMAVFISKNTLDVDFDSAKYQEEARVLEEKIKPKIMELYQVGDQYLLYSIRGENRKTYNSVISDYEFLKKENVSLAPEAIDNAIKLPGKIKAPDKPFPKKFYKDRCSYKGVKNVSDMF